HLDTVVAATAATGALSPDRVVEIHAYTFCFHYHLEPLCPLGEELSRLFRGESARQQPIKHKPVPPQVLIFLHEQTTCGILREDDIRVRLVLVFEDRKGAVHPRMGAGAEWNHLDGDVRALGDHLEPFDLLPHEQGAAHHPMEDALIDDRPEFDRVLILI